MKKTIRWNEPRFDNEELEEVATVIKENFVNEGPKTKELEQQLRQYLKTKYVILTTSGTAALYLAIKAESIRKKKKTFEVIIPDLTMFATAAAVTWAGGTPIPVDVKEKNLTINTEQIEKHINENTLAILPVHTLGRAADIKEIERIAKKHGLSIIEDAAGSLGSQFEDGTLQGTKGIGCFSLQSNKIITTGQGGIIALNDEETYNIIKKLRDFGRANKKEHLHEHEGQNLKFNDLSAALGIAQFKKIREQKQRLQEQYNTYKKELENEEHTTLFEYKENEIPLWIEIKAEQTEGLQQYLQKENIHTRKCWPPIHRNKPYKNLTTDKDYPVTSKMADSILWLPNGPGITKEDIKTVCHNIKEYYKNMITYKMKTPTYEEYQKLRKAVEWGLQEKGLTKERIIESLQKCPLSVCAYHKEEIIGMVRLAGDLGMYGYIQDTIVLPEYQGKGVGKELMKRILKDIKTKEGYLLGVCPSKVSVAFYESFGFKKRPEQPNGFMSIEVKTEEN